MHKTCKGLLLVILFCSVGTKQTRAQLAADMIGLMFNVISTCDEGGYEYKQTLFNNYPGSIHGIKSAWGIGQKFTLGTGWYFLYNKLPDQSRQQLQSLTGAYVTVFGEYHFRKKPEQLFDYSAIVHAGPGAMTLEGSNAPSNYLKSTSCWIFEPGINFNMRFLRICRLSAGASYRIVSGVRLFGQTDGTLSGPSLNLCFQFTNRGF